MAELFWNRFENNETELHDRLSVINQRSVVKLKFSNLLVYFFVHEVY